MTELERIAALPSAPAMPEGLPRRLTEHLRKSPDAWVLRDCQAEALWHAADAGGLFADLDVGAGKTLISLLLPTVCDLERPLLLVPASLRKKTLREKAELETMFKFRPMYIRSYADLSRDKDAEGVSRLLDRIAPDGIIMDEADRVMNLGSGRTRKLAKYIAKNKPKVYAMSGSFYHKSLMDIHHLLLWTLRERSPLPLKRSVCMHWAEAVDPGIDLADQQRAAQDTGIVTLGQPGQSAREIVGDRIRASLGVVSMDHVFDWPLEIIETELPISPLAEEHIKNARSGQRPDGEEVPLITVRLGTETKRIYDNHRLLMQLAAGYWTRWDPPPPKEWLAARNKWTNTVNAILNASRKYDTREAVKFGVRRERSSEAKKALLDWERIKSSYKPTTVPIWIDQSSPVLEYATHWLREKPGRLCWTEHIEVAKVLAAKAGVSAYGAGQGEGGNPMIEDAKGASAVVTLGANKAGRNLQHEWHENLFLTVPSKSATFEQAIGRTHRPGQTKPVQVEVITCLDEHVRALQAAYANAAYVEGLRAKCPKLLQAKKKRK